MSGACAPWRWGDGGVPGDVSGRGRVGLPGFWHGEGRPGWSGHSCREVKAPTSFQTEDTRMLAMHELWMLMSRRMLRAVRIVATVRCSKRTL